MEGYYSAPGSAICTECTAECKSRVHQQIDDIKANADQLTTTEKQLQVSIEIRNITDKYSGIMNAEDVQRTSEIIDDLIDFNKEEKLSEEVRNNTITVIDSIHKSTDAKELSRDDVSSSLRRSFDNLANRVSEDMTESDVDQSFLEETIGLVVSKTTEAETSFTVHGNRSDFSITNIRTGSSGHNDDILLSVQVPTNSSGSPVTAIVYNTPKFYPDNNTVEDVTSTFVQQFTSHNHSTGVVTKVSSLVTDIKYADGTETVNFEHHQEIKINFSVKVEKPRLHYKMPLTKKYECVFYNTTTKLWESGVRSGCTKELDIEINGTRFLSCHCKRMTSFAVLMSFESDYDPLEGTVTSILLGISIVCLCFTILSYLPAKEMLRTPPVRINLFFFSSMILSTITFYLMEHIVTNDVINMGFPSETDSASNPCLAIAFLMNYLWLCQVAWMVCEAVMMHRVLVSHVFDSHIHRYMLKFNLACWGIPLIFPIIGLVWGQSDFADPRTCFLRKKYGLATFYGPVILGILFNIFNFVRIAWSLFREDNVVDRNVSQLDKRKRQFKTAIKMMTLLGTSWIFGFFLIINKENTIWLRWLFIIFNSIQGTAIFFLYPVLNKDLRKVWKNMLNISGSAAAPRYRTPGARTRGTHPTRAATALEMEPLRPAAPSVPPRRDNLATAREYEESSNAPPIQPCAPPIPPRTITATKILFKVRSDGVHIYDNIASMISDNLLNDDQ